MTVIRIRRMKVLKVNLQKTLSKRRRHLRNVLHVERKNEKHVNVKQPHSNNSNMIKQVVKALKLVVALALLLSLLMHLRMVVLLLSLLKLLLNLVKRLLMVITLVHLVMI
jgi:hypothetical protein